MCLKEIRNYINTKIETLLKSENVDISSVTIAHGSQNLFIYGLFFALGIFIGKFIGGIFADKFGFKKIINISFLKIKLDKLLD